MSLEPEAAGQILAERLYATSQMMLRYQAALARIAYDEPGDGEIMDDDWLADGYDRLKRLAGEALDGDR